VIALKSFSRLLLLTALTLGGCSWFGDDKNPDLEPMPLMVFEPEGALVEDWSVQVGDGQGKRYTRLRPALVDDTLFVADAYGLVEARSLEDGALRWQARIGLPEAGWLSKLNLLARDSDNGSFVTGGVGADAYTVLLGTRDGVIHALRADDGEPLWTAQLSSEILSPPAVNRELVLVLTSDGRLTALNRSDGARLWSYDTQVPVLTLRGGSAPLLSGGFALGGFASGRLVTLRASNGQVLWENAVGLPAGRSELERIADVDSTPLLKGGVVFAVSYQGAVKALRLQDGQALWERPLSSYGALAEGYGAVFVTDDAGSIFALDQNDGVVSWQQPGLARRGVTGPAVAGGNLLVADEEGYVHLFAQADGRPLARRRADRKGVRLAPLGDGERFYVYSNRGRLQALRFEASP
jgi:outer membrane protein assembly factor BamB